MIDIMTCYITLFDDIHFNCKFAITVQSINIHTWVINNIIRITVYINSYLDSIYSDLRLEMKDILDAHGKVHPRRKINLGFWPTPKYKKAPRWVQSFNLRSISEWFFSIDHKDMFHILHWTKYFNHNLVFQTYANYNIYFRHIIAAYYTYYFIFFSILFRTLFYLYPRQTKYDLLSFNTEFLWQRFRTHYQEDKEAFKELFNYTNREILEELTGQYVIEEIKLPDSILLEARELDWHTTKDSWLHIKMQLKRQEEDILYDYDETNPEYRLILEQRKINDKQYTNYIEAKELKLQTFEKYKAFMRKRQRKISRLFYKFVQQMEEQLDIDGTISDYVKNRHKVMKPLRDQRRKFKNKIIRVLRKYERKERLIYSDFLKESLEDTSLQTKYNQDIKFDYRRFVFDKSFNSYYDTEILNFQKLSLFTAFGYRRAKYIAPIYVVSTTIDPIGYRDLFLTDEQWAITKQCFFYYNDLDKKLLNYNGLNWLWHKDFSTLFIVKEKQLNIEGQDLQIYENEPSLELLWVVVFFYSLFLLIQTFGLIYNFHGHIYVHRGTSVVLYQWFRIFILNIKAIFNLIVSYNWIQNDLL